VQKKGLGKGLGALIPGAEEARQPSGLTVELQRITANPLQPRRQFDETRIRQLAGKLDNPAFLDKAPAAVVAKSRAELSALQAQLAKLTESLIQLPTG